MKVFLVVSMMGHCQLLWAGVKYARHLAMDKKDHNLLYIYDVYNT